MIDGYVICTTPRSGSTLLCRLLENTGVAGIPESYFHRPSIAAWANGVGLDPNQPAQLGDIIDAIAKAGRGPTDLFGLRLQRHSFAFFMDQLEQYVPNESSDAARLHATFGRLRYIHLTRKGKTHQAISAIKAQQTGLWHKAPDGREIERLSPPTPLKYDALAIGAKKAELKLADAAWEAWFEDQNITPMRITYEELEKDSLGILTDVLVYLECDPHTARGISIPTARLADEISQIWAQRFDADRPT